MQAESSGSRCICCLAEGKHQQGTVSFEIFRRCLNLIVIPDSKTVTPMCSACISFVNEVQRFREMVLASQSQLHGAITVAESDTSIVDLITEGSSPKDPDKDELRIKVEICEQIQDSMVVWPDNNTAECIIDDQTDVKNECKQTRPKRKIKREEVAFEVNVNNESTKNSKEERKTSTNAKNQLKTKRKKTDSESDTPISVIKEKKLQLTKGMSKKEPKPTMSPTELIQLRSIIKENNKIRSNIILLLKHSTIIPFLNNFKSPFKCFYCDKRFIPFKELKEHTELEHDNICEIRVRKVLRKLPEYLVTADISCLKCKLCEEEFKSIENLTEHLIKNHDKMYNETDKKPSHGIIGFDLSKDSLKCHVCAKVFPFFKNLLVHMNEHGSFVCYICGKKFFSERKYRSHVSKHEKIGATCKQCGKSFVSKSALGHHNRKEHIKSTIKCLKCPETFHFEHYSQRLEHMEKAHGIKKPVFRCETCGKECKTSGILSTHINLTHKRNKEYRCDICSYATFNNSHFRNHMNTHTGVKNHECEYCKKRFLKLYSLTRHLMMHMNDKRFKCPRCDAAFIQKANMKSHLRHRHKDFDLSKL